MISLFNTFLIFLIQFVVLPFGTSHFETPKVVITEITIIVIALFTVWNAEQKRTTKRVKEYIPLLGLCLLSVYHLLFARHDMTFLGNAFRMQGIFLFWLLILFAYISSQVSMKALGTRIICVLLMIECLAAIFVTTTVDGRAIGTLGEPNALAASVIFLWPWLWLFPRHSERSEKSSSKSQVIGVLMAAIIIIFSGSRSGLIAFGIQSLLLLAARYTKISLGKQSIICLCLLAGTLFLPFFDTNTLYENRGEIWKTAIIAGYEHPIVGWGIGNTEIALKQYNHKLYNRLQGYYVDSAHNLLLDWWVQGGLIGLSLIVYLFYTATKQFVKQNDTQVLAIFTGVLAVTLFNPVSVVTLIQFWWLIGQGLAANDG